MGDIQCASCKMHVSETRHRIRHAFARDLPLMDAQVSLLGEDLVAAVVHAGKLARLDCTASAWYVHPRGRTRSWDDWVRQPRVVSL